MKDTPVKRLFIITGTTRGIGRALLQEVLKMPEHFAVSLSREESSVDENHRNIHIDLNDSGKIASALDEIPLVSIGVESLETTVLINNAGVLDPISPVVDCDDGMLEQNLRVNLLAPMILSKHFYHFSKSFSGSKWIVNITSGAARTPYSGWAAYGASKAGLDIATRTMALEFSQTDPRFHICGIAPGTVDTDMQKKIRKCTPDQFAQVDKFVTLKQSGSLFSPEWTAMMLIRFLLEGRFENGGRYDLREMTSR